MAAFFEHRKKRKGKLKLGIYYLAESAENAEIGES
jgi:hypothetical protein